MKCSLLTLSTFIDGELEARKQGELEAHLVGCRRCHNGLAHLREEVGRVGALARLHVPDISVGALFEQLGLIDAGTALPPAPESPAHVDAEGETQPWMGTEVGAALPWRSDKPRTPRTIAAPASLGGVPWMPSPPPTPPQGERPWEGGTPAPTPAEPGEESGESSVELAGTAQDAESEAESVQGDGRSPEDVTGHAEAVELPPMDELPPPPPSPVWTSAGRWTGVPLPTPAPSPAGWYPPAPPMPKPGPIPVEPPPVEAVAARAPVEQVGEPADEPVAAIVDPPPDTPNVPEAAIPEEATVTPTSMLPTDNDRVDTLEDVAGHAPYESETPIAPRRAGRAGLVERIRERIALQRALRHSADDEDSVEIVSGTGAPTRFRQGHAQIEGDAPTAQPALPFEPEPSAPAVDVTGVAQPASWPAHDGTVPPPAVRPERDPDAPFDYSEWRTPVSSSPPSIDAPHGVVPTETRGRYSDFDDLEGIDHEAEPHAPVAHFPSDAVHSRVDDVPPLQELRDDAIRRHGLNKPAGGSRPSPLSAIDVAAIAATVNGFLSASARRVTAAARRIQPGVRIDRRLGAGIAACVLLLAIGLALGKTSTPLTSNQTGATNTQQDGQPATGDQAPVVPPQGPATSSQPAAPAPAQPQGNAIQVNDPKSLGGGSTGVSVNDIRYGNHPGDFRIVLDMSGPGSPTTVTGFTDAQTFVVVLSGTTATGNLGTPPAGGVVTAVSVLPSSMPGQTVIQFKLAHAVTRTQGFLAGPLRLVIDLK